MRKCGNFRAAVHVTVCSPLEKHIRKYATWDALLGCLGLDHGMSTISIFMSQGLFRFQRWKVPNSPQQSSSFSRNEMIWRTTWCLVGGKIQQNPIWILLVAHTCPHHCRFARFSLRTRRVSLYFPQIKQVSTMNSHFDEESMVNHGVLGVIKPETAPIMGPALSCKTPGPVYVISISSNIGLTSARRCNMMRYG